MSDVLKVLKKLHDDLDDDFKWLEAVRQIRSLTRELLLPDATATVNNLLALCDQLMEEYPTADVIKIRDDILGRVKGLIEAILYRHISYTPNRDDVKQTVYQILIARLERGRTQLTLRYIGLIVTEAIHGRRQSYEQLYDVCRKQAEAQRDQHRAEYGRICKETNQTPTEAGFEKHLDQWCSELAGDILNYQEPIVGWEDEGGVEPPAPETPVHLYEHELEDLHAKIKGAFMSVRSVPPARLVHVLYQTLLRRQGNEIADEIGCHPSDVTRDFNERIPQAIRTIGVDYDSDQVRSYLAWLKDGLPDQICFAHANDVKFLILYRDRREAGEVMWEVYDWFRRNWVLLQFSQNLHIEINERWYMEVVIDCSENSAEITRLTLQKAFRR